MGLDYSYILYFSRDKQWQALKAVVDVAKTHQPPVKILFPDRELLIPLETWDNKNGVLQSDEPELNFPLSIFFEEDEAIRYYLRDREDEDTFRSPPVEGRPRMVSIGFIYLTIYNEASGWFSESNLENLVAFNFGTTGTRMSMLFFESTSIRARFVELLERVAGICGVFNQEERGEVFWYKGQMLEESIPDPYLSPSEIKSMLNFDN